MFTIFVILILYFILSLFCFGLFIQIYLVQVHNVIRNYKDTQNGG